MHIFEPSSINIDILKEKFKDNRVIINSLGLSNKNHICKLFSDKIGSPLASLTKRRVNHFNKTFDQEEDIKVIKFDNYWKKKIKSDIIDLFKIDAEGHELDVLNGIGAKIKDIKVIQFEFGGCNIDTRTFFQDFWYFFKEHNFTIYRITPFTPIKVDEYREIDEKFITTNYFSLNNRWYI